MTTILLVLGLLAALLLQGISIVFRHGRTFVYRENKRLSSQSLPAISLKKS